MRNEFIAKLRSIFGGNHAGGCPDIPDGCFPYRTQVPLLLGVSAVATFERMERFDNSGSGGSIPDDVFSVPSAEFREVIESSNLAAQAECS